MQTKQLAKATSSLLKLAAESPFTKVLEELEKSRAESLNLRLLADTQVTKAINDATEEYLDHLSIVRKNNPNKTIAELLQRQDIIEAMLIPPTEATLGARNAINNLWAAGKMTGAAQAARELELLGIDVGDITPALVDTLTGPYKDSVLSDLDKNLAGYSSQLLAHSNSENLDEIAANTRKAASKFTQKARAGVSVAGDRAHLESQLTTYKVASYVSGKQIRKVWVCSFNSNTCPSCAALHGTTLSLEQEFNSAQTFAVSSPPKIYADLQGPPRHPHCRCKIVPIIDGATTKGGPTPDTMKDYGLHYAEHKAGMAPKTWASGELSNLAKTSSFMEANDLRTMSLSKYNNAKANLLACLLGSK